MDIPVLDKAGLRKFGLVTGVIVVVLFALLLPWLFNAQSMPIWPFIVAAVLWVPAILLPNILRPVYTGWMTVGQVVGWINTRIILGIVFYLLVLPMGLLMRIFGSDPMGKNVDTKSASFRVNSANEPKDRLEKPY